MTWLRNSCATNDYEYVMFVVHDLSLGGFVARVTRQVPYMEHELLTLVKHMCSRLGLGRVPVARSLVFCVMLLFVLFRLVIASSLPLQFTESSYPPGIFTPLLR
jgi:hypothetical protein